MLLNLVRAVERTIANPICSPTTICIFGLPKIDKLFAPCILSTPQGESPELSKDDNKLRCQPVPPMNGFEEAGGAQNAAPTIKSMDNQQTLSVQTKTVR